MWHLEFLEHRVTHGLHMKILQEFELLQLTKRNFPELEVEGLTKARTSARLNKDPLVGMIMTSSS